MILTRKIELLIAEDDGKKREEIWYYLRSLEKDVFQAANFIVNHQLFNDFFKERITLTDDEIFSHHKKIDDKIQKFSNKIKTELDTAKKDKLLKDRKKLYSQKNQLNKEARLKAEELYLTSEQNTTYQLIRKKFPNLPSYISAALNAQVNKNFKQEIFDVKRGLRTVRTYRNGMPIPFMKTSMRFSQTEDGISMDWLNGICFYLRFGRDFSNNKLIVERAISGDYKLSDSQIQFKKGKIFLLLCVDIPDEKNKLDASLAVGVDLGLTVPAYCALSEGLPRLSIGSREDFLRIRLQMQARRIRLQRNLKLTKGGKGRKKKLKALERLKEKEKNFARTYNHKVSYQIVKFAKDHGAGIIKIELLEGIAREETDQFVLRNWSYFQLQTMLEYKTKHEGIKLVSIDPYHTSQTCSYCDNYEEGQRISQKDFLCKNANCTNKDKHGRNVTINADFNAARNIANSNKIVKRKEECEYYKNNKIVN